MGAAFQLHMDRRTMTSSDLSADLMTPAASRHLSKAMEELAAGVFTFIEDAVARQSSASRNAIAANLHAAEKASTALAQLQTTLEEAMARPRG